MHVLRLSLGKVSCMCRHPWRARSAMSDPRDTQIRPRRRIRVHNMARSVTSVMQAMFKGADLEACVASLSRRSLRSLPAHSVDSIRQTVTAEVASTLHVYRKHCAPKQLPGQLVLPETLKMLPLFSAALLKSNPFRSDLPLDMRAAAALRMR